MPRSFKLEEGISTMLWWQRYPIAGSGLIIVHDPPGKKRQVLLLEEKKEKLALGKPAGSKSFPMETRLESENSPVETLWRLLEEELAGTMTADLEISETPRGLYQLVPGKWLLVFWATSHTGVTPTGRWDAEVSGHEWNDLAEAVELPTLRQGAKEALRDRRDGLQGRICDRCEVPPLMKQLLVLL
ncbi:MAG: hypothetical protein WD200_01980 [Candidatus Andersenbacteria bacterium]